MELSKPGSKYAQLYEYLRRRPEPAVALSLAEIEAVLGAALPASARKSRAFWSNRRGGLQASAWLAAGFTVVRVDLQRGEVVFHRRGTPSSVGRRGGAGRWSAEAVRALREHLGLNQAGMAEVLGVRQQTISEWETGVYEPSRGRSKHLDLIAERAGFGYEAGTPLEKP
jgi:hypothetical protein